MASIVTIFALASCGSDSGSDAGTAATTATTINYGHTTTNINPYEIPGHQVAFGELSTGTPVNTQLYSSSNIAIQLLAAGKLDIIEGSVMGVLPAIASGVPIKVFCPYVSMAPNVMVGLNDVTSLEDLQKPSTRVAIESPGGPTVFATDLVLMNKGLPFTSADIPTKKILESHSLRYAALANGDADSAIVDRQELSDLRAKFGNNVHILSELAIDAGDGIYVAFMAKTDWLESNRDEAVAFCAAVMNAMVELEGDYNRFVSTTKELLESDISDEVFRAQWDAVRAGHLWPYDRGIPEASYDKVNQIAQEEGLTDAPVAYADVVDNSIYEDAKKQVSSK